ncbi:heme peroxidase [Cynara cardunculus var. scolymus]|uniref:Peroxidase n=1 Tax=Cynara cardunculus var. scolymus TaxID=59895 RepID=A0A103Y5L5_CYNCS|nr:heme peroxidase [Cynara cardunculus var. scolymus]
MAIMSAFLCLLLILSFFSSGTSLSSNYYSKTCPNVESLVRRAVRDAATTDKKVPAALLRMHFHDCFIRGCDASVLLNSNGKNTAEKDGPPNVSLHAFYVIDNAKKVVESACPGIVSCADILAFAARDAVVLLQKSFAQRGLSLEDLVALSGGHTLGFSHCSSFKNRIHNFNSTTDIDPSIHPSFAATLRSVCPAKNAKNAGVAMDPSSASFDNTYYKLIFQQKALFSSDKALLDSPKTKNLASKFASSEDAFTKAFIKSMIKMSSITGGQEVRKDCRVVN